MKELKLFLIKNSKIITVLYIVLLIILLLLLLDREQLNKTLQKYEAFTSHQTKSVTDTTTPEKAEKSENFNMTIHNLIPLIACPPVDKDKDKDSSEELKLEYCEKYDFQKKYLGTYLSMGVDRTDNLIFTNDIISKNWHRPQLYRIFNKECKSFSGTKKTKGDKGKKDEKGKSDKKSKTDNSEKKNKCQASTCNWNEHSLKCSSKKYIIIDLTYDRFKRLLAVTMSINPKTKKIVYDIFRKKTTDYESEWLTKPLPSNQKMRSLCYDSTVYSGESESTGRMIGCHSYDGQIYECKYIDNERFGYKDWVGPINFDVPMKKVMYDKEGIMIGIGLLDNFIYRKDSGDWRNARWDKKNINRTYVFDLIYDYDGCFIAATPEGIKKQKYPDFQSEFEIYDLNFIDKKSSTQLMTHQDIISKKIGFEFSDEDFNTNTELGRNLKKLYEFKKISKDLCNSTRRLNNKTQEDDIDIAALDMQDKEIDKLYNKIDTLTSKMGI